MHTAPESTSEFHLPSLKERLISGGIWAIGGRAGGVILALATNVLLARLLVPADLGAYFLASSLITLGWLISAQGLHTVVVRLLAEDLGLERVERVRQTIYLILGLGASGGVVVSGSYLLFGDDLAVRLFDSPQLAGIAAVVAAWIMVGTLQGFIAEVFRGFSDIRLATIFLNFNGLLASGLLVGVLGVAYLSGWEINLTDVVMAAVGAGIVSLVLGAISLNRKLRQFPRVRVSGIIKFSALYRIALPLGVTHLVIFAVSYADLWIVGAVLTPEDVAVYGAALRTVLLIAAPIFAAEAVVPPIIAELHSQGRAEELQRVLRMVTTFAGIPALAVLLSFILFGGPILGLVFGGFYSQGALPLALLSFGQAWGIVVGLCGVTLNMTGHQTYFMVIMILSSLVAVLGALWAVEHVGLAGIAAATAAGYFVQGTLGLIVVRWKVGIWTHFSPSSIVDGLNVIRSRYMS